MKKMNREEREEIQSTRRGIVWLFQILRVLHSLRIFAVQIVFYFLKCIIQDS